MPFRRPLSFGSLKNIDAQVVNLASIKTERHPAAFVSLSSRMTIIALTRRAGFGLALRESAAQAAAAGRPFGIRPAKRAIVSAGFRACSSGG